MTPERKSVSGWRRTGALTGVWLAAVVLVQSTVGVDIARDVREGEQRIELRIRERFEPPPPLAEPPRTDEESIEPWELVSV